MLSTFRMLCVLSCHVRELCVWCPEGARIFGRRQDRCMCGSWMLPRDTGCVWCAPQVQPWPPTRMVSDAMSPSRLPRVEGCREAHVQSFGAWARRRFLAEAMEISFISFSDISLGRAGYFSTFLSTFIFFNISSPQVMAYRFQNFQWFCPLPLCCVRHNRWKRWQTSSKLR